MGYEHIFDGTPKDYPLPNNYKLIDTNRNLIGMISSTEVRKRISEARAEQTVQGSASYFFKIGGLVSKSTIEYIHDN